MQTAGATGERAPGDSGDTTAPARVGSTHTDPASAGRSMVVDVVKGLAILLVTVGHTNQGILRRGWWHSSFGDRLDGFIYAFHMPAFFFVSGVFLLASLRKRGFGHFARNKVGTLLYPFWLWALLMAVLNVFVSRWEYVPRPIDWKALAANTVTGNMEWFLPTLFVASMLAVLFSRLPLAPVFVASWLASRYWHPLGIASIDRAVAHLPFVIAGMALGPWLLELEGLNVLWSLLLAALSAGLVLLGAGLDTPPSSSWLFVPLGLAGTALLIFLGRAMGRGRLARGFAWLGMASFGIYLTSPYGQGFGRQLLLALHVQQPVAQLLVSTLFATVPTAWAYQHRRRWKIGWLFLWPESR